MLQCYAQLFHRLRIKKKNENFWIESRGYK